MHYCGDIERRQETTVSGGGGVGGDTTWVGPPTPPGSLELVKVVIFGYS